MLDSDNVVGSSDANGIGRAGGEEWDSSSPEGRNRFRL
jgi:hypothetical protein